MNRKKCDEILKKKKILKSVKGSTIGFTNDTVLYAHENMCPYYSHLSWKGRQLKRVNLIHATWFQHGTVVVKTDENGRYEKVFHNEDLDSMFPDFNYEI